MPAPAAAAVNGDAHHAEAEHFVTKRKDEKEGDREEYEEEGLLVDTWRHLLASTWQQLAGYGTAVLLALVLAMLYLGHSHGTDAPWKDESTGIRRPLFAVAGAEDTEHNATLNVGPGDTGLLKQLDDAREKIAQLSEWRPYAHGNIPVNSTVHMQPMCGSWQLKYIKLHEEIREAARENGTQRFLVYSCDNGRQSCGGLGDVLLGISSVFAAALLLERAIILDWRFYDQLWETVAIDWRVGPEVRYRNFTRTLDLNTCMSVDAHDITPEDVIDLNLVNSKVQNDRVRVCMHRLSRAGSIIIRSNRGSAVWLAGTQTLWGHSLRRMGLRDWNIGGCLYRFLFRPTAAVLEKAAEIASQIETPGAFSVCLHVRAGKHNTEDNALGKNSTDPGIFWRTSVPLLTCAQRLTDHWALPSQPVKWYFMSSSYAAKLAAKRHKPDTVLITPDVPQHSDFPKRRGRADQVEKNILAIRDVMAEWYSFSLCDFMVFQDSGMSKTAALYSMKPDNMFLFPRAQGANLHKHCNILTPTTMFGLTSWSGA